MLPKMSCLLLLVFQKEPAILEETWKRKGANVTWSKSQVWTLQINGCQNAIYTGKKLKKRENKVIFSEPFSPWFEFILVKNPYIPLFTQYPLSGGKSNSLSLSMPLKFRCLPSHLHLSLSNFFIISFFILTQEPIYSFIHTT